MGFNSAFKGLNHQEQVRLTSNAAERSGDRIPVEATFSELVQTGSGAHLASCVMGTGFLSQG